MFATDGLLGEWLDLFQEEDGARTRQGKKAFKFEGPGAGGALVLDLRGAEFPLGAGRVRAFGRVRISTGCPGRRERSG